MKGKNTDSQRQVLNQHTGEPTPVDYGNILVEVVTGKAAHVQCRVAGKLNTLLLDTGAHANILNKRQ
jgi:hypothetical protein